MKAIAVVAPGAMGSAITLAEQNAFRTSKNERKKRQE